MWCEGTIFEFIFNYDVVMRRDYNVFCRCIDSILDGNLVDVFFGTIWELGKKLYSRLENYEDGHQSYVDKDMLTLL